MDPLFDQERKPWLFYANSPEKTAEHYRRAVAKRELTNDFGNRATRVLRRFSWEDPTKTLRGTAETNDGQ